jgi:hypothetical protein
MTIFNFKSFWNILGKLSLVLIVVWTAIQIYGYFSKGNEYNIKAEGDHLAFVLPDSISKPIESAKSNKTYFYIKNMVANNTKWSNHIDLADTVMALLTNNLPESYSALMQLNSYWQFHISNNGIQQISDLYLETPFEGYYFIQRTDSTTTCMSSNESEQNVS